MDLGIKKWILLGYYDQIMVLLVGIDDSLIAGIFTILKDLARIGW